MKKKKDIYVTFDFETLGNTTQAPPVQIAAVAWLAKKEFQIVDDFTLNINVKDLQRYDFKPTYSTILWWLSKECAQEARDDAFNQKNSKNLADVITEFELWLTELRKDYKIRAIWQHGSFDDPILRNITHQLGYKMPYHYRLASDIRTLKQLKGEPTVEFKGTKHIAIDDCRYQAEYLNELLFRSAAEVKRLKKLKDAKIDK